MERILQSYLVNEYNNGRYFVDPSGIISILDDIKKKYLYPNDFHGLYHSQKVCFFAYLILPGRSKKGRFFIIDLSIISFNC